VAHIREQHRLPLGSYGRPRMTEELKELGFDVGHRHAGRLMRQNGISVVRTRKHKVTTNSNHKFNIASNLLNRNFLADRPNQKWPLGDASIACQLTGCRYQLYLDPRGLVVFGRSSGPLFETGHRLGCQQSHETRPCNPCAGHGGSPAQTTEGLYSSLRSRLPVLLTRLPETFAPTRVQSIHEWQRKLLSLSWFASKPLSGSG